MKNRCLLFLFSLFFVSSYAQESKFKGIFKGQSIYILNAQNEDDQSYCISSIFINNVELITNLNVSAFQINFSDLGIKVGDKLNIVFKHKRNCEPSIVNLYDIEGKKVIAKVVTKKIYSKKDTVIEPNNNGFGIVTGESNKIDTDVIIAPAVKSPHTHKFQIINAKVNSENILSWTTEGETNVLPLIVEQYRWNRWVLVCEIMGYGEGNENKYSINVIPHSANNRFRISQKGNFGETRYSDVVNFFSDIEPVELDLSKVTRYIKFPNACLFEIYDEYGDMLLTGFSSVVDLKKLKTGKYYINYDNLTKEFKKRKDRHKK